MKISGCKLLVMAALTFCLPGAPRTDAGKPTRQLSDVSGNVLTKPKVLFSLPYGEGSSEIGLYMEEITSSISDFVIGKDGSIYIGDEINGTVKRFSRDSKLLMMTAGRIDRIAGMAVDGQGKTYVIHGAGSDEIAVYDAKGGRIPQDEDKIKKAIDELPARHPELPERPGGGELQVDASDNLYLIGRYIVRIDPTRKDATIVNDRPSKKNTYSYSRATVQSGQEATTKIYGVDGELLSEYVGPVFSRVETTVYAPDGSVVRKVTIPSNSFSEIEKQLPSGGVVIEGTDGRGHFYTMRSPLEIHHIAVGDSFVVHYYAILEYDQNGKFIGVRAVLRGGFMTTGHWVKVDTAGNVYWLDFQADRVNIMMAPIKK